MRFCDFFIEYKLRIIKETNGYLSFKEIKNYKKAFMAVSIILSVASAILEIIKFHKAAAIIFGVMVACIIVTVIYSNTKKELDDSLINNYKPYSKKRTGRVLKLLNTYGIDKNDKEKLTYLMEQCDLAKEKYSILKPFTDSFNKVSIFMISIPTYIIARIADETKLNELIIQGIEVLGILACIVIIFSGVFSELHKLIDKDSSYYDELKYDLQQMIIFEKEIFPEEFEIKEKNVKSKNSWILSCIICIAAFALGFFVGNYFKLF